MLELIATCLLAAGTQFLAPAGWTITEVGAQGQRSSCTGGACYAIAYPVIESTYVTLRRPLHPGERAQAPDTCTLEVTVRPPDVAPKR